MVGRRPSVALDDLRRYWGEVELSNGLHLPRPRRYDLVIAQEPTLRVGLPALMQAKLSGATMICEVHSNYLETGFLPPKDRMAARLILKQANFVRAVSRQIASSLGKMGVRNVLVIPSVYIKLNIFKPFIPHTSRRLTVLTVARLVPQKGLELLIEAVPLLARDFRGVEVRIVGDGPEKERLKRLADRLGVGSVVRFYGWVGLDELVRHYNEAAVFVCTSHHEGGPRTVFEAAACQTPFVSTAVGLVPEVFTHGREVFIVRKRDPAEVAEHVSALLSDAGLREEMGRRGREIVAREFEWEKAVRRYAEAYIKIYSSRR
ncbi:GDP-mannose-dependent alpha-(1-6)-phosphatidylinositol monomannoside mannosyltransferase [Candidatus Calditenuaceae archaeon HR02]|nr:GDP-mannose-dependent alpha-(1-6)-phosphatidylinositol monomannoside mannosyltransferase [Candidatus Calditenuaceae archaeon HR02]